MWWWCKFTENKGKSKAWTTAVFQDRGRKIKDAEDDAAKNTMMMGKILMILLLLRLKNSLCTEIWFTLMSINSANPRQGRK